MAARQLAKVDWRVPIDGLLIGDCRSTDCRLAIAQCAIGE
jgi:hypothetical protein